VIVDLFNKNKAVNKWTSCKKHHCIIQSGWHLGSYFQFCTCFLRWKL